MEVVEAAVEELEGARRVLRGPVEAAEAAVAEPVVEQHRQEEPPAWALEALHTRALPVSQVHSLLSVREVLVRAQRLLRTRVDLEVPVVAEASQELLVHRHIVLEVLVALLVLVSAVIH